MLLFADISKLQYRQVSYGDLVVAAAISEYTVCLNNYWFVFIGMAKEHIYSRAYCLNVPVLLCLEV